MINYEYLEIYESVLSKELCKEIIDKFELQTNKYDGITFSGLNKTVKNTTDFHLIKQINGEWNDIDERLYKALNECLQLYRTKYDAFAVYHQLDDTGFQIQKYLREEGFYIYHHDFLADKIKGSYRVLTFLFYLNDIEEGGETEFFYGKVKVKPQAGKCVLFPASWTFPHKACMPISDDKYIITGWLYVNNY